MSGGTGFPFPYSEFKVFKVDPSAMKPTYIETRGFTFDIAVFNDEPGGTTGVEDFRPGEEVEWSSSSQTAEAALGDEPCRHLFVVMRLRLTDGGKGSRRNDLRSLIFSTRRSARLTAGAR
jgi:hypothetical protein